MIECNKPNCDCIEKAEQANGGQPVKNYPCLADRKNQIDFITGADKPFFIDTFRSMLNRYDKGEISISKLVENLNMQALNWHNKTDNK